MPTKTETDMKLVDAYFDVLFKTVKSKQAEKQDAEKVLNRISSWCDSIQQEININANGGN